MNEEENDRAPSTGITITVRIQQTKICHLWVVMVRCSYQ